MKVLIIKTSSMGDIIHTLPALTDAARAIPGIQFDWVIEENFKEIPRWHNEVNRIIPVALRRWRKKLMSLNTFREWKLFYKSLCENKYDIVLDAQGLLKSAWLPFLASGLRAGPDWSSARESLASLFYQRKCSVDQNQHAVVRMRKLFAAALNYTLPDSIPDYGIDKMQFSSLENENYLIFFHGTTWPTKHYPEEYWIELANLADQNGLRVKLPWGNEIEHERAMRIAAASQNVVVLPKLNLIEITRVLANAKAVIAVDTGFGHLAAALAIPTISLYGPTNPELTGAMGQSQIHLSAQFECAPCLSRECQFKDVPFPPCFTTLPPEKVWQTLNCLMS